MCVCVLCVCVYVYVSAPWNSHPHVLYHNKSAPNHDNATFNSGFDDHECDDGNLRALICVYFEALFVYSFTQMSTKTMVMKSKAWTYPTHNQTPLHTIHPSEKYLSRTMQIFPHLLFTLPHSLTHSLTFSLSLSLSVHKHVVGCAISLLQHDTKAHHTLAQNSFE